MIVERAELFRLMGLSPSFGKDSNIVMASEGGNRRATARWNADGFSADVTAAIEGESGELILSLAGTYSQAEDGFDLDAEDNRDEASAPEDPRSVANAYRLLTGDMATLG